MSCASVTETSKIRVLDYNDFGPQAVANEIIGMEWWQWEKHGDPRPGKYNIKIVVYQGIELTLVKNKFPVNKNKFKDYRYVEFDAALDYFQ